ncbi:antiterminator LoaP [Enorma phocaeensis]|uniref:Antiterminator LoaP n=1 Tax=Enorma phocaeensis TaxID=1871019 RepID=A0ABT7V6Q5_9ACTN|nr:antiterminator LoaP [Enorma phocaeensis]
MWYVVQVQAGRETVMEELISRVASRQIEECFYPQYETQIKLRGCWTTCVKPLFPGYLVAVTECPEELEQKLLELPEFARVLVQGGAYVPLAQEEVELIGGFTSKGKRVVPMSFGIKDGDRVVVTRGPLVGHEGMIRGINRRKSTANLEIDLCGRKVAVRVGLGIVTSGDSAHARAAVARRKAEAAR